MKIKIMIAAATFAMAAATLSPGAAQAAQSAPHAAVEGMPTAAVPATPVVSTPVSAAPVPAAVVSTTADGTYDVQLKGIHHTFSHTVSVAMYQTAKYGGVVALTAYCATLGGPWGAVGCGILATFIVSQTSPPPPGRCYEVHAKFGWPPFGAKTVNC